MLILTWLASAAVTAQEPSPWPNWRGPLHNGTSPDAERPTSWSENENVSFRIPMPGESLASPVTWGDRVFVITARPLDREAYSSSMAAAQEVIDRGEWPPKVSPTEQEFKVYAFDRFDGSPVWERVATTRVPHESHYLDTSFACASQLTDGDRLYVHFGSNGTYAYDLDGELLWQVDLGDMQTR